MMSQVTGGSCSRTLKILKGFTDSLSLNTGDFISISPHAVMTHDNTGPVIKKYSHFHRFLGDLKLIGNILQNELEIIYSKISEES